VSVPEPQAEETSAVESVVPAVEVAPARVVSEPILVEPIEAEPAAAAAVESASPVQGLLDFDAQPASTGMSPALIAQAEPSQLLPTAESGKPEGRKATVRYIPVKRMSETRWWTRGQTAEGKSSDGHELPTVTSDSAATSAVLPTRKKILVADDDQVMRMLLKMGLSAQGYECLLAENGRAAQELVTKERPDLILVDLLMPVMDGLAFIQWLRQTLQDKTPVLVFTNVSDPKIAQEALRHGANEFACKPVHLKELLNTVGKLVCQ